MSNPLQPGRLDGLSIASPCTADWNHMQGDERRRFCAQCQLHVHDLSAMSKPEAEQLLAGVATGRVCVRLFRRADGTVLTRDCPVGLRQKLRRAWARAAALWLAVWASAVGCVRPGAVADPVPPAPPELQRLQGEAELGDAVRPTPVAPEARELMGRVKAPPEPSKK